MSTAILGAYSIYDALLFDPFWWRQLHLLFAIAKRLLLLLIWWSQCTFQPECAIHVGFPGGTQFGRRIWRCRLNSTLIDAHEEITLKWKNKINKINLI
jgi:hypothetical protein